MGYVGDMPLKNTVDSQLRNKKGNLYKKPCSFTGVYYSKRKRVGIPMIKIAIFYQKESKLLDDIRKEACQSDNVYAIYEYSTIDAFRKANEESPMDIVFVEDTTDNCGLAVARYIREKEQRTSFYFFGKSANRAFYGYEYRTAYYLTEKEQVESLNIYQHFFKKYFPRKTIFLFDQGMDSAWAMCLSEVVYIDLRTGDIYTEKGEKKSGYILTEKVLETIRKNPTFLNVSGEYLVNQDFIIGVVGLIIHLYQNKRILCKEKEIDTLKAFLWNMGQKEIL